MAVARSLCPDAKDLSAYFAKLNAKVAGPLTRPVELIPHMAFTYPGSLEDFESVLMVDDMFGRGVTTGAMLFWLHCRGLKKNAKVSVAVPLRANPPQRAA